MAWSKRAAAVAAMGLIVTLLLAVSAEDKQLSIYAPQASFTVRVSDREGREYVDLFAVLEPLVRPAMRLERDSVRIVSGAREALLTDGEMAVIVGQKRVRFPAKIILADNRPWVPMIALPALLQEIAALKAELHENGRRLFIENTQTRFSIEMRKGAEPELALSFPARVTPNINQEGNRLRLTFQREPVVMTADNVSFQDASISNLRFEEKNGVAEMTITGNAPLLVAFADEGKTLLVRVAPAPAAPPVVSTAVAPAPASVPAPPPTTSAPPQTAASPFPFDNIRYIVMIDPAHGGSDPGVKFSDKVLEKDITLNFAKRLRTELHNRGIPAMLTRDADATLTTDQRAVLANGQRAAIYITLHAGSLGTGVRVYAPMLQKFEPVQGPFVPWTRAQENYLPRSVFLARAVATEMSGKKLPARTMSVAIPPLNAIAATSIAIEMGPPSAGASWEEFDKPAYQQAVTAAAAAAIANNRGKLEEMQ